MILAITTRHRRRRRRDARFFRRPIAVSIPAPTQRFGARRDELSKALIAFRDKMRAIVGR